MPNVLQNAEKSSNIAKNLVPIEENLSIFTIIVIADFGTKNVHSAMGVKFNLESPL